jgi:hypothetical protein
VKVCGDICDGPVAVMLSYPVYLAKSCHFPCRFLFIVGNLFSLSSSAIGVEQVLCDELYL